MIKNHESLIKEDLAKKGLNDIFEISAEHSKNLIDLRTFIKASLPKEKLKLLKEKKLLYWEDQMLVNQLLSINLSNKIDLSFQK